MKYDFKVRAGNSGTLNNDVGLEVMVKRKVNGVESAFDLTGYNVSFVVRVSAQSSPLITKSSVAGEIEVDAVNGKVMVPISPEDTRVMLGDTSCRSLIYELERRRTSPVVQRPILYGDIVALGSANNE